MATDEISPGTSRPTGTQLVPLLPNGFDKGHVVDLVPVPDPKTTTDGSQAVAGDDRTAQGLGHNHYEQRRTSVERTFKDKPIPVVGRGAICRALKILTLGSVDFYEIPDDGVMLVMAFGRVKSVKRPGFRAILSLWGFYKTPWTHLIPMWERTEHIQALGARTSDGLETDVYAFFTFRIIDPKKAIFDVEDFAEIKKIAAGLMRNECGRRRAADLLSARPEMASSIKASLKPEMDRYGLQLFLFDIAAIKWRD